MDKLRIQEVIVVEGKYDAAAVHGVVDGLVLTTGGFSIYNNEETKALLRRLGKQRGLLILTDSDYAGFQIRRYVEQVAQGCTIKHAYIPAVPGKEGRKNAPSAEGTLGVEGLPPLVLREALAQAGATLTSPKAGRAITYTDLYEAGISGGTGSAAKRHTLLKRLGLPPHLSKKAMLGVLQSLYTYEEFTELCAEKPVLFWDFHATLSLPEVVWFDAALAAIAQIKPAHAISREEVAKAFDFTCLPWWECENRDTRHVSGSSAWWAFSQGHFVGMLQRCGLSAQEATAAAPLIRAYIINPANYHLYADAVPTLAQLQKRGYRHYLLSNNFPELGDVMQALGLAPYFSGYIISGELGYEKPRPEIFAAAKALAKNPASCWMVGDNPHDDIAGGHAAGFTTVAVHNVAAPEADYQINDLQELLALLP